MPSDEVRIAQTVRRMLAGESARINDLEPALRPAAHAQYIEAVQAGKSDPAVIHAISAHRY